MHRIDLNVLVAARENRTSDCCQNAQNVNLSDSARTMDLAQAGCMSGQSYRTHAPKTQSGLAILAGFTVHHHNLTLAKLTPLLHPWSPLTFALAWISLRPSHSLLLP
jgi:hypothetical protein